MIGRDQGGVGGTSQQISGALGPHTNNNRKPNPGHVSGLALFFTWTLSSPGIFVPGSHHAVRMCVCETPKAGLCGLVLFVLLAIGNIGKHKILSYKTIEHHT